MKNASSFSVVREENGWICVWKNANTLSVPSRQGTKDARLCVGMELQELLGQQIYPVHRLDFEVAGLLVFAKTPAAQSQLNRAFELRQIHKYYRALCLEEKQDIASQIEEGRKKYFQEKQFAKETQWHCKLAEGKRRSFPAEHGKESFTKARHLRALTEEESHSLLHKPAPLQVWELEPVTGRRHQLRLHMCLAGIPVLGDILYGAKAWRLEGIALCSHKIDFSQIPEREALALPDQLTFDFSTLSRKQMSWASI